MAHTATGIKDDTVASFREFGVIYHRLLDRIPAGNPSRDPPPVQAMRYIQAAIKSRPQVGTTLMHHFASHGVDQSNPAAVRDAIMDFLEEQAAVRRLCSPQQPTQQVVPTGAHVPNNGAPTFTLPDLNNIVKALVSQSLVNKAKGDPVKNKRAWDKTKDRLCRHCGGGHFDSGCTDKRAGTNAYSFSLLRPKAVEPNDDARATALINGAFAAWDTTQF